MKTILKKRKKLIIVLAIIAAAIIVAVIAGRRVIMGAAGDINQMVELQEIQKRDLSEYVSLTGTVSGSTEQNYTSTAGSEITAIHVSVGDTVKEGDVIATLDTTSIQAQIDLLEKSISNAQAINDNQSRQNKQALSDAKADQSEQLNSAQSAIDQAKSAYDRAVSTYNSTYEKWENKKKEWESAKAALDGMDKESDDYAAYAESVQTLYAEMESLSEQTSAAEEAQDSAEEAITEAKNSYSSVKRSTDNAIRSAQNTIDMEQYTQSSDTEILTQLDTLKKQLEDCSIVASSEGVVTAVNVKVGDTNTPGASIVSVEDNQNMVMTASVSEDDILKLKEGMKAQVTIDALGEGEIQGELIRVVRVASSTGVSSGEGTNGAGEAGGYSVEIKLDKSEAISGMTAKAKITLTEKPNVLCVPYDLVQTDENGDSYVLCGQDNGDGTFSAVRKDIQTGEEVDYFVEVTGGDLTEGEYVIMDYSIQEGDIFPASIGGSSEGGTEDGTMEQSVTVG